MKTCVCILLISLMFLSACAGSDNQDLARPSSTTTQPSNDASSQNISSFSYSVPVSAENAEGVLRATVQKSSFILEGTVRSVKTIPKGQFRSTNITNSVPWDMYTFSDLEIITGRFEEDSFILQVEKGQSYSEKSNSYEIGRRYIIFAWSTDAVFTPQEEVFYQDMRVRCLLSDTRQDVIESMMICDYPLDMPDTKDGLLKIIKEEIGLQREYYNIRDMFVHSDDINTIIMESSLVLRIKVTDRTNGSSEAAANIFGCEIQELYKSDSELKKKDVVNIVLPTRYVKIGSEYIVLCQRWIERLDQERNPVYYDGVYIISSRENSVIPTDDKDRVQKVYKALGFPYESLSFDDIYHLKQQ